MEELREDPGQTGEILDYQNMAAGGTIPVWVSLYLEGGNRAVENLEEYQNQYVFVSTNSGSNFSALEQWKLAFNADLDFARLAAVRIDKRLLNAAVNYPDNEYGSYYVALIRAASDAEWHGAVRDKDFWVLQSYTETAGEEDELPVPAQMYCFLVLVKVDRELLDPQIRTLMRDIKPEAPLTKEQAAAINRIQERFFDGF